MKQMTLYSVKLPKGTYIGLDLAAKTGWAIVTSDGKNDALLVDYGSIAIPHKVQELDKLKYVEGALRDILRDYIVPCKLVAEKPVVVIEDCFLGKWNPKTFKLLARLEGYVAHSLIQEYPNEVVIHLVYPSHARKLAGVKGNAKKEEIAAFINNKLKQPLFKTVHNNIADAVVLAIAGGKI